MSTLVPVATDLPAEVASWVQQLDHALSVVHTLGADEAAKGAQTAREVREILRLRSAAHEVGQKAFLLECQCLRRLAALKALGLIRNRQVTGAAEFLATLSEEELLAAVRRYSSPCAIQYGYARENREARRAKRQNEETQRDALKGEARGKLLLAVAARGGSLKDWEAVRKLAQDVVAVAAVGDESTTVTQIVDRIFSEYTLDGFGDNPLDPATRRGIADAVRDALNMYEPNSRSVVVGEDTVPVPKWVTWYQDGSDGSAWIRVPFQTAQLGHLRSMAALREGQATQLREKADQLHDLVALLISLGATDESSCAEVLKGAVA